MKKFQFRLQPLLKLRKQIEDQKQRVVAELLSEINTLQQQALELNMNIQQQGEILKRQRSAGEIDVAWFGNYRSFVVHTQQAIQQRVQDVRSIQEKLAVARQDLAQAAKETKILEKLKDRRFERYNKQLRMAEARQQDEVSTNMFLREHASA